uniref:Uncharacterized protein n=1 Tax=Triticum urartu TaxID=4572 RepID=A0A8R7RAA6_TRIUA
MERREGRIGTARLPTAGPTMAPVTGSVAPRLPVSSQDGPAGRCPDGRVCAIHGTHLLHPGPPPQHRRGHYFVRTDYHNDAQVHTHALPCHPCTNLRRNPIETY